MKKIVSLLLISVICLVGVFAVDFEDFPRGTWTDAKQDAEWSVFDESIQLVDAVTGSIVFIFTENNVSDLQLIESTAGLTLSFSCAKTERAYSFTKAMSTDTSLIMEINPDWTKENYKITMPLKM